MSISTRPAAPVKRPLCLSARLLRVGALLLLAIDAPGRRKGAVETTTYLLQRLDAPEGEAFRLSKLDGRGQPTGDLYDLRLSTGADDLPHDGCDCAGGTFHGRCKHALALRMVQANGEL
jgi:hypothetical protein